MVPRFRSPGLFTGPDTRDQTIKVQGFSDHLPRTRDRGSLGNWSRSRSGTSSVEVRRSGGHLWEEGPRLRPTIGPGGPTPVTFLGPPTLV